MKRARGVSDDDAEKLCRYLSPRWEAVWRLTLFTGWRIGDVLCLPAGAVTEDGTVQCYAQKTGRLQTAQLPLPMVKALRRFEGQFWQFPSPVDPAKPITRQAAHKAYKRAARRAGIAPISPHSGRRTYAQRLMREGLSVTQIQRFLGHSKPEITLAYLLDVS